MNQRQFRVGVKSPAPQKKNEVVIRTKVICPAQVASTGYAGFNPELIGAVLDVSTGNSKDLVGAVYGSAAGLGLVIVFHAIITLIKR